ncbi:MAG: hypothetical protein ACRC1H_05170, partial [Caldilineaceae bacterium]
MADATLTILLALRDPATVAGWLALARRLGGPEAAVHVRGLATVPESRSLSEGALAAREWRETLEAVGGLASARAVVDYQPLRAVCAEASALPGALLIVDWAGPRQKTGGVTTDEL